MKIVEIGHMYGRWTVLQFDVKRSGELSSSQVRWICRCACGKEASVRGHDLISGRSKSCGGRHSHNLAHHPNQLIWHDMVRRCSDPKRAQYKNYGARGITVCARWLGEDGLRNFIDDVGVRPPGMTLERRDNNKGYEPGNVRWATVQEQAHNRRTNRVLVLEGRAELMSVWAKERGISKGLLHYRLRVGWSVEKALLTPARKRRCTR